MSERPLLNGTTGFCRDTWRSDRVLQEICKIEESECFWLGSGERQSRYHLVEWALQRRRIWMGIGEACEWKQEYVRGLKGG